MMDEFVFMIAVRTVSDLAAASSVTLTQQSVLYSVCMSASCK